MARQKVKFKNGAIRKLMNDPKVIADLERRAKAVADAANRDSSWGGYFSALDTDSDRPRARVWNIKSGAADDESRNNRLIRGLDSAR